MGYACAIRVALAADPGTVPVRRRRGTRSLSRIRATVPTSRLRRNVANQLRSQRLETCRLVNSVGRRRSDSASSW